IEERSLVFPKVEVFSSDLAHAWTALFSNDVLVESGPGNQSARFAHNILFDYAVSVLAIPFSASGLVEFLLKDPSRPLFLRPSLLYYFVQLWYGQREQFWQCFWRLLSAEEVPVKLVSRLLPPYVVAGEAKSASDLEPLIHRCRESDDDGPRAVLRILQ